MSPPPANIRRVPDDTATFAPFSLLEYEHAPGTFCLVLFDGDMEEVEDAFQEVGAEANGHGWEALAISIVRSQMPDIEDRLQFTSESGTFAVGSADIDALRRLAAVLQTAFHDRDRLAVLIRDSDDL